MLYWRHESFHLQYFIIIMLDIHSPVIYYKQKDIQHITALFRWSSMLRESQKVRLHWRINLTKIQSYITIISMAKLRIQQILVIVLHAFILWALCGATMVIGLNTIGEKKALIVHLIGAPIFASIVSIIYFKFYNFTNAIQTAFIFLFFIVIMDAGLVAPVFNKSYAMFSSILGTWLPFVLIFTSTYLTGYFINKRK